MLTKEVWELDLTKATWNVRTMLIPGKMQEISKEMMKYKIDIIALQEIQWQGQGRIDKPDYTRLYSGSEEKTDQLGTRFMMKRTMKRSLLDFEPQNNRICKIRLKERFRNNSYIGLCTYK
jgi:exonuclease III